MNSQHVPQTYKPFTLVGLADDIFGLKSPVFYLAPRNGPPG